MRGAEAERLAVVCSYGRPAGLKGGTHPSAHAPSTCRALGTWPV